MNRITGFRHQSALIWLTFALFACPGAPTAALGTTEPKFDTLQVGTQLYKNVTVTTRSTNYVFILHSEGMTSLKVKELPSDVLEQLGYANPNVAKVQTNSPAVWAKQTIAKLDSPEIKEVQEEIKTKWNNTPAGTRLPLPSEIDRTFLLQVAGTLLALYLFYCFCCNRICIKAASKPGILVWLPVLQMFPLLKAARMSAWWFLAFFVPVLNLVAHVLWCFRIADARGKTALVGFLLVFPPTAFFAFLYLALSAGVATSTAPIRPQRIEVMALETA